MSLLAPLVWDAQLDPDELKDYTNSWAAELTATGDTLSSSTFILPTDAVSAGLEISSQGSVGSVGTVFFEINISDRASSMWNEPGTIFRIRHQITTAGGRRLERSIYLTVAQK